MSVFTIAREDEAPVEPPVVGTPPATDAPVDPTAPVGTPPATAV